MWPTWVAVGAVLGIILGWEGSTFKNDDRYRFSRQGWPKFLLMIIFGVAIASQVTTVRGFLIVYLSSLGAFYLAKPIGEVAQRAYYRWRDPHPEVDMHFSSPASGSVNMWIRSKSGSPIIVEKVILKSREGKVLPLKSGTMQGRHYDANSDGWLTLNGGAVRNNSSMCITLNADNWNNVGSYRVLGKDSNDMHWLVENQVQ